MAKVKDLSFENLEEILGISQDDIDMLREVPKGPPIHQSGHPCSTPNQQPGELGSLTKVEKVYEEFESLVHMGKEVLESASEAVRYNPDGENLAGLSSLINTVKDTLKEFSKVHLMQLRHEQQLAMEEFKANKRIELVKTRTELSNQNDSIPVNMVQFSQESLIDSIIQSEQKLISEGGGD